MPNLHEKRGSAAHEGSVAKWRARRWVGLEALAGRSKHRQMYAQHPALVKHPGKAAARARCKCVHAVPSVVVAGVNADGVAVAGDALVKVLPIREGWRACVRACARSCVPITHGVRIKKTVSSRAYAADKCNIQSLHAMCSQPHRCLQTDARPTPPPACPLWPHLVGEVLVAAEGVGVGHGGVQLQRSLEVAQRCFVLLAQAGEGQRAAAPVSLLWVLSEGLVRMPSWVPAHPAPPRDLQPTPSSPCALGLLPLPLRSPPPRLTFCSEKQLPMTHQA